MKSVNSFQQSGICCFYAQKNPQAYQKFKYTGAAIIAALSAIASLAMFLLILANQGVNLGAINSLSSSIQATEWLYAGFGISCSLLIIDTIFIIKMLYTSHKEFTTVRQDEVFFKQSFIMQKFSHNYAKEILSLSEFLLPFHYTSKTLNIPHTGLQVEILVVQCEESAEPQFYFFQPKKLEPYRLKHYFAYIEAGKDFSLEQMRVLIPHSDLENFVSFPLEAGYYRTAVFYTSASRRPIYAVQFKKSGEIPISLFFKEEEDREAYILHTLSSLKVVKDI